MQKTPLQEAAAPVLDSYLEASGELGQRIVEAIERLK